MFEVNNKDTGRRKWRRSGVFIIDFDDNFTPSSVSLFLLLTLDM